MDLVYHEPEPGANRKSDLQSAPVAEAGGAIASPDSSTHHSLARRVAGRDAEAPGTCEGGPHPRCPRRLRPYSISYALWKENPRRARVWPWQYAFPASRRSGDPRKGAVRRHHLSLRTIQRRIRKAVDLAGIRRIGQLRTSAKQLWSPHAGNGQRVALVSFFQR